MPISLIVKLVAVLAVLAVLYTAWLNDREAYAAEKVAVVNNAVAEAAEKDKAEKARLGAERAAAAAKAQQEYAAVVAELGAQRERQIAADARNADLLRRLRASRATDRGSAVRPDPLPACIPERLRADQLETDLREGQRLAIEGAGLVSEAAALVGECVAAAREQSALIELAKGWARAVHLGAEPVKLK